ncbi:MAG: cofactor-independent phosphoglycerate mutase [Planctomycetia bacterium]|nr:cofactor-independent phosphoglycerate mutase [Planctomycetia bacterium]
MKYAIIIPDGCADEPQEALGGKTPLEAARVPAMDAVAAAGVVGRANHVPRSLPPGSDVANLSLLGYDPVENYTGRAPIEAVAQGIALGPDDWAVRCNLVTVEDQVMRDFTAGHISTAEATQLIAAVQEAVGSDTIEFHPGVSYRNLLVCRAAGGLVPFTRETRTTPPHDLTDKSVIDDYPRGPGSDLLTELMRASAGVLADHPVNVARRAQGKPPATTAWLWGQGGMPKLAPFAQRYGVRGAMITAVDLLRGLAELIGWRRIEVPGATGYTDTDYAAKGRYAIRALDDADLVCVHVEATDEASHEGDTAAKIKALEEIDRHIVGPVHEALRSRGEHRILVTPDHPTPLRIKTHSHGTVPFAMAGAGIDPDAATAYDDPTSLASALSFDPGWRLMSYFLGRAGS